MRRCVLIVAIVLLTALSVFVFGILDGSRYFTETPFSDVPVSNEALPAPDGAVPADAPHLSVQYAGTTLPVTESGAVLIPLVPESGLTVTADRGASIARAVAGNGAWRISAEKNGVSRSLTLTPTGIGVCCLEIPGLTPEEQADPIGESDRAASLVLLSEDENGGLRLETARVSVRIRGHSSRTYEKKSYTISVNGPKNKKTPASLMGFTADKKFGLNSMYEDDSKIRDALSLGLWRQLISPEDKCEALRFRYCELFINGEYRGLYGFQQLTTDATTHLSAGDGMVKIAHRMWDSYSVEALQKTFEVKRKLTGENLAEKFADALLRFDAGDETAAGLFDTDNLMRVFVFIQTVSAVDNRFENMAGIWRAEENRFQLAIFDTDLTFGLTGDRTLLPLKTRIKPELSRMDMIGEDPGTLKPVEGLLRCGERYSKSLAELYFSLRETVLSEEALIARSRELFSLVTDSGARAREHERWPQSGYTLSDDVIETFIDERLAWCDEYFGAMLEGKLSY